MIRKPRTDLPKQVAKQVEYMNFIVNHPELYDRTMKHDIETMQQDKYWYMKGE